MPKNPASPARARDIITASAQVATLQAQLEAVRSEVKPEPIHAVCPQCGGTHVDRGEWATNAKLHRSHLCEHCGHVWRPFEHYTVGVEVTPLSAEIPEGQRLLREVNCELQLRELREVAETMHAVLGRYKSANRDAYVAWHKANDILKKVPR